MKLSKLSKLSKKVLAVVLALAMTFVGSYFMPKTVDAGSWIDVTNGVHDQGTKYQLGTTSDTDYDGKWFLQTGQNQWSNWRGAYKDADGIEGFAFDSKVYHNGGGVFLWSSDLKSEFGLTAGTTYEMSVTISYTGVAAAQNNFVFTEGGNSNMNEQKTIAAGTSEETYTATIEPTANDFVLRISWTNAAYEEAQVGQFEVTDVTFTAPQSEWINVTPGTHDQGTKYQLGTTSDTDYDGKWFLQTGQNQWNNWYGAYKNAGDIEGFAFNSKVYHNGGGVFLWSSDLKSEFGLTAGTTYEMSVTISYTGVEAAQNNFIFTEGGNSNMNEQRTVAAGDSEETYTASVVPTANDDFVLRISWTDSAYHEAQKGIFEVTDVTFTAPQSEWINVTPGTHDQGTKYQLGTTSDTDYDGKWFLQTGQNQWSNWYGAYKNAGDIEGFAFDSKVYHNGGGVFLWSSDLKSEFGLTAGTTYEMSVTISYTGVEAAQNNFIFTEGGSSNMNEQRTVAAGDSEETYTASVVPTANDDFVLRISWTDSAYHEAQKGQFEVTDVTFTEDTDWTNCIVDNTYHTIGTDGFKYKFRNATTARYQGGEALNDPLTLNVTNGINDDHDFLTKTPNATVTPGHIYKLTYNLANEGPGNAGRNFYAKVANASNDAELATNYNDPVAVNAGEDVDIELTFMAPESGEVYVELNGSYTPVSTYVLTPSFEDTTPDAQPITPGQWGYAGANNTGWQYFARANGSAYYGGTSMGDDLTINYGTYVNDVYTCIVRSPITAVDSAKSYTGTMTIDNNSKEALQAGNLHVSVHWYDSATGQDGEISAATSAAIPAGGSQTFDLSYTAPDSGYIFYEASTSYTPGMSSFTYSATHTPPADGRYDVAAYKSGSTATYPTESGKIFAGWYDDTSYTQVHSGNTGLAYAKFIDEKVLDVKFQKKNDNTAVRFVSTIDDCLDYESVGFKFTGDYGAKHIDTEKSCTKVYKNINADGQTLTPSTAFENTDSAYFFTYSVRNMDGTTSSTWTVTPFYVTPDGTKVYGTTKDYSM